MSILDLSWGVLFEPTQTFRRAPSLGQAAVLLLVATSISALASAFTVSPSFAVLAVVAGMGTGILGWLLRTAIWRLTAEVFGAGGSGRDLLAASGLAQLPRILAAPGALLGLSIGGWAGFLVSLGVTVWVFWLSVLAVRETQGLGTGASAVVVILPYVVLGALLVAGMILVVAMAVILLPLLDPALLIP